MSEYIAPIITTWIITGIPYAIYHMRRHDQLTTPEELARETALERISAMGWLYVEGLPVLLTRILWFLLYCTGYVARWVVGAYRCGYEQRPLRM